MIDTEQISKWKEAAQNRLTSEAVRYYSHPVKVFIIVEPEFTPLIKDIIYACAEEYKVSTARLISYERTAPLPDARNTAFLLIKKHAKITLEKIGSIFGARDHSTIIAGIKTAKNLIDSNPAFKSHYENILKKLQS